MNIIFQLIKERCFYHVNKFAVCIYLIILRIKKNIKISPNIVMNIKEKPKIKINKNVEIRSGVILSCCGDSSIRIKSNVVIQENTYLMTYKGKGIVIGEETNINKDCILYGHGGLKIGENFLIAAKCVFIPANHIINNKNTLYKYSGETREGIIVGNNVWFGTGVIVLDGVSIGDNSVIGAGSVVTKSVPENTVYARNPAKFIRYV